LNQLGGSTAEPSLEQNQSNFPKTSSGTGYKTGPETGSRTGERVAEPSLEQNQPNSPRADLRIRSRAGLETGFEPISPSIPAREESVFVDPLIPRPSKHQSSHPLDQILSDINTRVQTRSKLKNLCAFYAFLSSKSF